MDGIVLYPKTKDEFELIKQFAEEKRIGSFFIPQEELEFLERKKLADSAGTWYPSEDISIDEIVSLVKETRAEIYARKDLFGN